jgi:hypothetical protein
MCFVNLGGAHSQINSRHRGRSSHCDVLRWEFNSQEVFNESIKIRQNYNCGQGYPHCCKGFYLFIPASAGRCARAKFTIRELKFYY